MKKIIGAILCPLILSACDNSLEDCGIMEEPPTMQEGVQAHVTDYTFATDVTRSTITPTDKGLSFAWAEGDQIGIYAENSMASFNIKTFGEDAKSAKFDGGGFALVENIAYFALYPYTPNATNKSEVKVSYKEQVQLTNNSTEHLSATDYMTAQTVATGPNTADFNFKHLNAVMRIKVTLPVAGRYTKLAVSAADDAFTTEGVIDLTSATPQIQPETRSKELSLQLGSDGIEFTASNLQLTTYFIVAPTDLRGKNLTITVTNSNGDEYISEASGLNMEAGKAYGYSVEHMSIDLGLPSGVLWATTNVGAKTPTAAGGYYSWGESFERDNYGWSTYSFCKGNNKSMTKYGMTDEWGVKDGLSTLEPADDTATQLWGSHWRMPTNQECEELISQCYWAWYANYEGSGMAGYAVFKVKNADDKGVNSLETKPKSEYKLEDKHIFLPAAGSKFDTTHYKYKVWGNYWSSNISEVYGYDGLTLSFWSDTKLLAASSKNYRYYGYSVRPVLNAR